MDILVFFASLWFSYLIVDLLWTVLKTDLIYPAESKSETLTNYSKNK